MRRLLIVGTLAFDDIETPSGRAEREIGGSATYAALAASFSTPTAVVGIVGHDFPQDLLDRLAERRVDLAGIQRSAQPSMSWSGRYHENLNDRETLDVKLDVLGEFSGELPEAYRDCEFVFLGNIDPDLQLAVVRQLRRRKLVACDTMNYWLENARAKVLEVLREIDMLIINDEEARMLTGHQSIARAALAIRRLGPRRVLIKRGEYGVIAFDDDGLFAMPAYPLEEVLDPTGAGDSFAGGVLGHLTQVGGVPSHADLRRAIAHGSVMASMVVERFGLARLWEAGPADIEARRRAFLRLTDFHTI